MTKRIYIHEVITRDGLQIEPQWIATERKIELVDALSQTGLAKIEVTSFVSTKAIPHLRDAAEVMAGIKRNPALDYVALIANAQGAERAVAAKVDEVNLVASVFGSHNRANMRRSTEASFAGFADMMPVLKAGGVRVNGALATSFGCPFEGDVPRAGDRFCTPVCADGSGQHCPRRHHRHGAPGAGARAVRRGSQALARPAGGAAFS